MFDNITPMDQGWWVEGPIHENNLNRNLMECPELHKTHVPNPHPTRDLGPIH